MKFPTDYHMASAFLVLGLAAQLPLDALTCLQSRTKQALSHLGVVAQIFMQKALSLFHMLTLHLREMAFAKDICI